MTVKVTFFSNISEQAKRDGPDNLQCGIQLLFSLEERLKRRANGKEISDVPV